MEQIFILVHNWSIDKTQVSGPDMDQNQRNLLKKKKIVEVSGPVLVRLIVGPDMEQKPREPWEKLPISHSFRFWIYLS